MHFGRVQDPRRIPFYFPPDTERTTRFLALPKPFVLSRTRIGCPIWAVKTWVSTLYPPGTKSGEYLKAYAEHFDTVEVNSSFYHMVTEDQVVRWREQVPSSFRFCPKVFRGISEFLNSEQLPELINKFCEAVSHFEGNLGLTFAQFPETFMPSHGGLLLRFLKLWPKSIPLALEFRNPLWFKNHSLLDQLINVLYKYQVATVITDTPGRQDVLHLSLTQPRVLIRFQGNELHPTDKLRLAAWAERMDQWQTQSPNEIYFITHQPSEIHIPQTAELMTELFRARATNHNAVL